MSHRTIALRGVFPALPTPFQGDRVALDLLRHNVAAYSAVPLAGYLVLGSTGEFPHLSEVERLSVIDAVAAEISNAGDDRLLIAGVGDLSTAAAVQMARESAKAGAAAVLVVPPFYYRSAMNDEALAYHYESVAEASPVPVVLYNIPVYAGVTLSPAVLERLAAHENVAGIKDSSGDLQLLDEYLRAAAGRSVLVGSAPAFLAGLLAGASGAILGVAAVAPWECSDLYAAAEAGDFERARRLQGLVGPAEAFLAGRFGVPGIKWAMDLNGYFGGPARPPYLPLTDEQKLGIRQWLLGAGLISGC